MQQKAAEEQEARLDAARKEASVVRKQTMKAMMGEPPSAQPQARSGGGSNSPCGAHAARTTSASCRCSADALTSARVAFATLTSSWPQRRQRGEKNDQL